MNGLIERLTGMHTLTDQVVAMDLLIAAKSGVRDCAMAVTEAVSPEIHALLARHLEEAVDLHEEIAEYMRERGWYLPWNLEDQLALDRQNIRSALQVPNL